MRMSNYEWREVLTEFLGDEGAIKTKKRSTAAHAQETFCAMCV